MRREQIACVRGANLARIFPADMSAILTIRPEEGLAEAGLFSNLRNFNELRILERSRGRTGPTRRPPSAANFFTGAALRDTAGAKSRARFVCRASSWSRRRTGRRNICERAGRAGPCARRKSGTRDGLEQFDEIDDRRKRSARDPGERRIFAPRRRRHDSDRRSRPRPAGRPGAL